MKKQTRVVVQKIILLEALNPLENGGLSQSAWIDPIRSVAGCLGTVKGDGGPFQNVVSFAHFLRPLAMK